MKRKAVAVWKGTGKEGTGILTTESTVLKDAQYSYKTRFEDGIGTNPEELIAAAHAGCFLMKLSFVLNAAGFTPEELRAECAITLENGSLTTSHITLHAKVPKITEEVFTKCVIEAKDECPVSKVLNLEKKVLFNLV